VIRYYDEGLKMALKLRLCAAYAVASLVLLSGCNAYLSTKTASGFTPNVQTKAHIRSWALPESKHDTLLYISDFYGVHVYSYPSGTLVGELEDFQSPAGLCSDKAGNVFVTDTEAQKVYEFAHGGTQPIATLYDNYASFNAFACSVDRATKTLAVTSADSNDVFLFKDEAGSPIIYKNPYAFGYFCTYDGSGNLFTRGTDNHIAELSKGSTSFTNIKLSERVHDIVGFAWDGNYLSINGNSPSNVNYRVQVNGRKATIVSKASLLQAKFVVQFTLYNHQLIGPDQNANRVSFWKYPKATNPVKTIGELELPEGSTISLGH